MRDLIRRAQELLSDLRDVARREPVLTRYAVAGVVTIAAGYGLQLDADAILAVLGISTAVATVRARRKVTPEADLLDHG